jgi:hypothetical protein
MPTRMVITPPHREMVQVSRLLPRLISLMMPPHRKIGAEKLVLLLVVEELTI